MPEGAKAIDELLAGYVLRSLTGEDAEAADRLQELRIREFEMALDSPEPYEEFARNVERVRDELRRVLGQQRTAEGFALRGGSWVVSARKPAVARCVSP